MTESKRDTDRDRWIFVNQSGECVDMAIRVVALEFGRHRYIPFDQLSSVQNEISEAANELSLLASILGFEIGKSLTLAEQVKSIRDRFDTQVRVTGDIFEL
jgi:hypothetical protein